MIRADMTEETNDSMPVTNEKLWTGDEEATIPLETSVVISPQSTDDSHPIKNYKKEINEKRTKYLSNYFSDDDDDDDVPGDEIVDGYGTDGVSIETLSDNDDDDDDGTGDKRRDVLNKFVEKGGVETDLIISTLKENALDLALSDQVEHLQTYNSHLLDELQKEKERCDELLRRNDELVKKSEVANKKCIESNERRNALETENLRLEEQLQVVNKLPLMNGNVCQQILDGLNAVQRSWPKCESCQRHTKDYMNSSVSSRRLLDDREDGASVNLKSADKVHDNSLELSHTGYESTLLGNDFVCMDEAENANEDGVLDATINGNSVVGPSDFILDWMEGAGFVGNTSSSKSCEGEVQEQSQESLQEFLFSPISHKTSPGDISGLSLDRKKSRRMFAQDSAFIRKKLSVHQEDVSVLLNEIKNFEDLLCIEKTERTSLERELISLKSRMSSNVDAERERFKEADAQVSHLRKEKADLRNELTKADEVLFRTKCELSKAEEKVIEITSQLERERERASETLQSSLSVYEETILDLEAMIAKHERSKVFNEEKQIRLNETIAMLRSEISATKHEAGAKQEVQRSSLEAFSVEVQKHRISIASLEGTITDLHEKLKESEDSNDLLSRENSDMECQLEKQKAKTNTVSEELISKSKTIDNLRRDIQNRVNEMNEVIRREQDMKKLLRNEVGNIGKLNSDIDVLSKREKELLVSIAKVQDRLRESEESNDKYAKDNEDSIRRFQEEKRKSNELAIQVDDLKQQMQYLNDSLQESSLQKQALEKKISFHEQKMPFEMSAKEKLERKCERLRDCVDQLNEKCEVLQNWILCEECGIVLMIFFDKIGVAACVYGANN